MKNEELLQAIHALAKERGIDEEVLFEAIEEAIVAAFKREFSDAKQHDAHQCLRLYGTSYSACTSAGLHHEE